MTVAELIEALKALPQGHEVMLEIDGAAGFAPLNSLNVQDTTTFYSEDWVVLSDYKGGD